MTIRVSDRWIAELDRCVDALIADPRLPIWTARAGRLAGFLIVAGLAFWLLRGGH